jgi:hypothetical protein
MSQINPFVGSILQASDVQRQQAEDKDHQAHRAADRRKDSGAAGDRYEHSVESSEEIAPIHDEEKDYPDQKRQQHAHHDDDSDDDQNEDEHLDLTA